MFFKKYSTLDKIERFNGHLKKMGGSAGAWEGNNFFLSNSKKKSLGR